MRQKAAKLWGNVSRIAALSLAFCFALSSQASGPPPVITVQPSDQAVLNGGTSVFNVVATSGTTLTYQWYKDGLLFLDIKLSGKTSSSLTFTGVSSSDEGQYFVEIKNAGGTVYSRKASLNVVANTPPVTRNDSYTTAEDTSLTVPTGGVLTNDTDINGQTLTAVLASNVTHGNLSLSANGGFVYTPFANYYGSDSFTYRAHDGLTFGNVATVTITVNPVNDPPVVLNDFTNTLQDVSVTIDVLANDSDAEGTALSITGVSITIGTVVVVGRNIVFTPPANFSGVAAFSYTASDGTNSATASVTVNVLRNNTPIAGSDNYTTLEDDILSVPSSGVLGNDSDVESNVLSAVLVNTVAHGTLALNTNGGFIYTPVSNFNGIDSFTYRASDGHSLSATNLEQGTSGGSDTRINKDEQGAQSFRHGNAGDPNYSISQIVLYLSRRSGGNGNLNLSIGTTVNGGKISQTDIAISASSITNLSEGSSFQTCLVNFTAPIGPFTAGTTYYLNMDNQTREKVYLEYANANSYGKGTYYVGGSNQNKDLRFQILGNDPSDIALVTLNVAPVNDAPTAFDDAFSTRQGTPLIGSARCLLTNDVDIDGDTLTTLLVSDVRHGTLSLNQDGSFVYTPFENYLGEDIFTYRANDGLALSGPSTVFITITPPPPAPNLVSSALTSGGFQFQFFASSTYIVEASTNLLDWTPIFTNSVATGMTNFVEPEAARFNRRFYRVIVR